MDGTFVLGLALAMTVDGYIQWKPQYKLSRMRSLWIMDISQSSFHCLPQYLRALRELLHNSSAFINYATTDCVTLYKLLGRDAKHSLATGHDSSSESSFETPGKNRVLQAAVVTWWQIYTWSCIQEIELCRQLKLKHSPRDPIKYESRSDQRVTIITLNKFKQIEVPMYILG